MNLSVAPMTACLVLAGALIAFSQDDPIAAKLLVARQDYKAILEKAKSNLMSELRRKQEAVQATGDLKTLEKLQAETEAFWSRDELPKSVPVRVYQSQMRTATARLEEALTAGVRRYTMDGKLTQAKAIQQELDALKSPGGAVPSVAEPDLKLLQGTWRCVREQSLNKDWTADELASMNKVLQVTGDRLTITRTLGGKRGSYDGRLRLSPGTDLNRFDLVGTGPGGTALQMAGIYLLNGNRLRICYRHSAPNTEVIRPTWNDVGKNCVCVDFEMGK